MKDTKHNEIYHHIIFIYTRIYIYTSHIATISKKAIFMFFFLSAEAQIVVQVFAFAFYRYFPTGISK